MSCSNFNPNQPSTSASNVTCNDGTQNSCENEDGKKSVTVLISDTGEITYDEETLQSIIDSDQELTTVTFLRVEGSKNSRTHDGTAQNIGTTNTSNQGLPGNINEDSMDAAAAILDAASINAGIDQLNSTGNEQSAMTTNNPIAMLNQEQISRLEKVLQSDEAKTMLDDVFAAGNVSSISEPENVNQISQLNQISRDEINTLQATNQIVPSDCSSTLEEKSQVNLTVTNETHSPNPSDDILTSSGESDIDRKKNGKYNTNLPKGSRRSQRQMDREMKEEAERIRKENQAFLQKEREQMKSNGSTASSSAAEETTEEFEPTDCLNRKDHENITTTTNPLEKQVELKRIGTQQLGRPKRERKVPAHLQGGDFVCESSGAQKEPHQSQVSEKRGKKSSFQLSKILPSPSKKTSGPVSEIKCSNTQNESLNTSIDHAPNHQTEKAEDALQDKDETGDETSDGDWESEDDPERLWCICQQPHNNRFMICCDSCLDWYHGKCVGITKKMGKEMEEAGNEWRCPTCKKKDKVDTVSAKSKNELEQKLEAKLQKEKDKQSRQENKLALKGVAVRKKQQGTGSKKRPGSAMSNDGKEEKKPKERTCFVCDKSPRIESIFCSDECIGSHVESAKEFLLKTKPKHVTTTKKPELPSSFPGVDKLTKTQKVMVMEPKTNTLISASAPNAPTEETLSDWLKKHPTFHVVMPKVVPTSKFYGMEKSHQSKTTKIPVMSLERQKQRMKEKANVDKRLKEYQRQPTSSLTSVNEQSLSQLFTPTLKGKPAPTEIAIMKSSKNDDTKLKSPTSQDSNFPLKKNNSANTISSHDDRNLQKSGSGSSVLSSSEKRKRLSSEADYSAKKRRDSEKSNFNRSISKQYESNENDFDPLPLRKNVTKGLKDAIKTRVEKTEGIDISDKDLDKIVKEIEEALYRYYNKDVGSKYKSKYRSLVFNIKDQKNNGLFRKIVRKEYSASRIASMTAEEMANKELKEWRQAELKHDIEKIKSHEMEMAQIGTKLVMKTHKGDMVMEDGKESSMVELKNDEVKLPDEVKLEEISDSARTFGIKTWEHGNHGFESQCDVCTEKISLDKFLSAKVERERKEKEKLENLSTKKSSSKHSTKSSHHRHKDERSSSKHRRDSSGNRRHSDSAKHRSRRNSGSIKKETSKDKYPEHQSTTADEKDDSNLRTPNLSAKKSETGKMSDKVHSKDDVTNINQKEKHRSGDGSDSAIKSSTRKEHGKRSNSSHRRHSGSNKDKEKDYTGSSHTKSTKHESGVIKKTDQNTHKTDNIKNQGSGLNNRSKIGDLNMEESGHTATKNKQKAVLDSSKLKGTVDDENETLKKEVTAEDVAKAESLIKKITSSSSVLRNLSERDATESEALPRPSTDSEQNQIHATDLEVVSSTVTIKTPDTSGINVACDSNPIVWNGDIHMPDVAKFSVTAKQVSGTTDYLTVDLKEALKIVGRIAPQTVWDYVSQVSESPSKEILLVRLEARTDDEKSNYTAFFNYLQQRNRLGVVGNNSKMVKDCYILPLGSSDTINPSLLPFDGPGIEEERPNLLLALIVRTKRKRPGDAERDAERHRLQMSKKLKLEADRTLSEISSAEEIRKDRHKVDKGRYKDTLGKSSYVEGADQVSDDDIQYDPATAGTWPLNDSPSISEKDTALSDEQKAINNDEIYDPESASFSPEDDVSTPYSRDRNLSIAAKMAEVNKEIEKQKAELAMVESKAQKPSLYDKTASISKEKGEKEKPKSNVAGFQGLPTGIASILFGESTSNNLSTNEIPGLGDISEQIMEAPNIMKDPRKNQNKFFFENSSKSASLSSLSDKELLAKAAAQMPAERLPQTLNSAGQGNLSSSSASKFYLSQKEASDKKPSSARGQIWQHEQFDTSYEPSRGIMDVNNQQSTSWASTDQVKGRAHEEYREHRDNFSRNDAQQQRSFDRSRSNRHEYRYEQSERNWDARYEYHDSEGTRRTWPNTRGSSGYHDRNYQSDERGKRDSNAWRDKDMRRQYNRDTDERSENRDRDYRSAHTVDYTRHGSFSRSKSKEEDTKPPGEDNQNFNRPFNKDAFGRNRSRSPPRNENIVHAAVTKTLQSIDERIADVVDKLPN